jgi:hypothetical protein
MRGAPSMYTHSQDLELKAQIALRLNALIATRARGMYVRDIA